MKKRVLIFVLVLVVFSLLTGCGGKEPGLSYDFTVFEAVRATGLYDRPSFDAEMIGDFEAGDLVRDISSMDYFSECAIDEEDIETCHIITIEGEREGWVIKKRFKKILP